MRVPFNRIFAMDANGMVSPEVPVRFGIFQVDPGPEVSFGSGASFGGVKLSDLTRHDFEVDVEEGVYVIKGEAP